MHDGSITTAAVDVMWGTDMSQTVTLAEGVAPVRQGVRQHFGAIGKDVAAGLKLRHDHGPNYMSDDFQDEIAFLGIDTSPSFVREPGKRRGRALHPYAEGKPLVGAPLRDSCAWRCSISPPGTIPTGWSPAMATGHLLRSGPTSNRPWIRPHDRRSRLSHNRGAVHRMDGAAACLITVVQYKLF